MVFDINREWLREMAEKKSGRKVSSITATAAHQLYNYGGSLVYPVKIDTANIYYYGKYKVRIRIQAKESDNLSFGLTLKMNTLVTSVWNEVLEYPSFRDFQGMRAYEVYDSSLLRMTDAKWIWKEFEDTAFFNDVDFTMTNTGGNFWTISTFEGYAITMK